MTRPERLLDRVLWGQSDANSPFRSDHHIFTRDEVEEIPELAAEAREGEGVSSQASSGRHPEVPKYRLGDKRGQV
ncbi:MAG: hypothetical protein OXC31_06050 [Spirochaetaceae bacterium]|nr:hypothetical protein [Spirochaetaceae bacterium]